MLILTFSYKLLNSTIVIASASLFYANIKSCLILIEKNIKKYNNKKTPIGVKIIKSFFSRYIKIIAIYFFPSCLLLTKYTIPLDFICFFFFSSNFISIKLYTCVISILLLVLIRKSRSVELFVLTTVTH